MPFHENLTKVLLAVGKIEAWVQGLEGAEQRGQLIMPYSRNIAIQSLNFMLYGSCQQACLLVDFLTWAN